jgi:hypothetical protein
MKTLLSITRVLGVLIASLAARVGVIAVGALVVIIVVAFGIACWVIASADRSDRVARLILARHGDASCLQAASAKPRATRPARARATRVQLRGRGATGAGTRPRAHR